MGVEQALSYGDEAVERDLWAEEPQEEGAKLSLLGSRRRGRTGGEEIHDDRRGEQ